MTKILFTNDTHFNHANIIKYCARPFSSILEMNKEMISRWNTVVGLEDTVYHLGDFAMGQASDWPAILKQLNGSRKILIRGGHDRRPKQMLEAGFSEVHEKLEWNGWLLQHRPMNTKRKMLCGHIHEKWLRIDDIINVGVDVWDFTPRIIEELITAGQSPREYECRYCGSPLQRLKNNIDHYDGKCVHLRA